jgi:arginine utilization protein RocB
VEKLNAEELEVAIQERDKPLIIDFYATWCGPCLLLAEELKKVQSWLPTTSSIVFDMLEMPAVQFIQMSFTSTVSDSGLSVLQLKDTALCLKANGCFLYRNLPMMSFTGHSLHVL